MDRFFKKNIVHYMFKQICQTSKSYRFSIRKLFSTIPTTTIQFPYQNIVLETREFYLTKGKQELPKYGYSQKDINNLIVKIHRHLQLSVDLDLLDIIIPENQNDLEALEMCKNEQIEYNEEKSTIENEIIELLCSPHIPKVNKIMLEVKAGVGGQEAMLFTSEIFQMYESFVRFKHWQYDIVNYEVSDMGGLRHATMLICGDMSYNNLQFEGGVHRVQRIPKTEKSGRLHTSTMTVAVLPQPNEVDMNMNAKDLKIETCRASGKGGQHVNTTDSAVRVVHLPTGMSAECQVERSQIRNKEIAIQILKTRLFEKEQSKIINQINSKRKLQVGSASRNEKIRTYNFKDDRITDHRISCNFFGVKSFLNGADDLGKLIGLLNEVNKNELVKEIIFKMTGKQVELN